MGDIAVMTMILKMSDCDAKKKGLVQMNKLAMLRCEDKCTKNASVTFNHNHLQEQVNKLQSPASKDLITQAFAEMFDDGEEADSAELVQVEGSEYQEFVNKTEFAGLTNKTNLVQVIGGAPKDDCRAEVYKHGNFKGWKATFTTGAYVYAKYKAKGAKNDDASAIKVFGVGCQAELYQHGDFKGWKAVYPTGSYNYPKFVGLCAKNDDASAIVVKKAPKKGKPARFNNPPVPRTKVPSNPCTDPNMGAPGAAAKRAAKCTLKKSPQCYKLQGRFLQIQAGIADSRDELMDQIGQLEDSCKEMKKSLEASIKADEDLLASS